MDIPNQPPANNPAKVFGVLHVVFASLAILMMLGSLVIAPLMAKITGQEQPNPLRDQWGANGYMAWMVIGSTINFAWPMLMLLSGIWLLKGLDKGRRLGNVWAVGSIIIGTIFTLLTSCWITPMVMEATHAAQAKAHPQPHLGPAFYQGMKWVIMAFGLIMGLAMAWVYQICALKFLNKPQVKALLR